MGESLGQQADLGGIGGGVEITGQNEGMGLPRQVLGELHRSQVAGVLADVIQVGIQHTQHLTGGQLQNRLETEEFFPGVPTVLVGDMNAEPGSEEMQMLSSHFWNLTEGIGITFHGFGNCDPCTIDYIFMQGNIDGTESIKWDECRDGVWLSDHFPVCSELTLK